MKKIKCSYNKCSSRRINYETDEAREHQFVEIPKDFNGKAYCSIECFSYDQNSIDNGEKEDGKQ